MNLAIIDHCYSNLVENRGYIVSMFLTGLFASVSHCISMCGVFVLAQVTVISKNAETNISKLQSSLLLPYHLGRMSTYTFLAVIAATLAKQFVVFNSFKYFAAAFLLLASFVFLAACFPNFNVRLFSSIDPKGKICSFFSYYTKSLLRNNSKFDNYKLGLLLGFLPCGLIFAILLMVAASANIYIAIVGMIAFTLGTMPALWGLAFGVQILDRKHFIKRNSKVLMGVNSFILAHLAYKMIF